MIDFGVDFKWGGRLTCYGTSHSESGAWDTKIEELQNLGWTTNVSIVHSVELETAFLRET